MISGSSVEDGIRIASAAVHPGSMIVCTTSSGNVTEGFELKTRTVLLDVYMEVVSHVIARDDKVPMSYFFLVASRDLRSSPECSIVLVPQHTSCIVCVGRADHALILVGISDNHRVYETGQTNLNLEPNLSSKRLDLFEIQLDRGISS